MSKNKSERAVPPATYLAALVIAAIVGFGTVYWSFAPSDNGSTPVAGSSESAAGGGKAPASGPLAGLNTGPVAAFLVRPKPLEVPEFSFVAADGSTKSLKDWQGKVVLLNLWATWCVPCREEMPALDKLQAALGGKDFDVVAINIDKGGPEKAESFLKEIGVTHLPLYADPTGKLFSVLKAIGMPTTLLIDRDGKEIGRLAGPADWASPEAKKLIEAAIAANGAGAS